MLHTVEIKERVSKRGQEWEATCPCGWRGGRDATKRDARETGHTHLDEIREGLTRNEEDE